jgi:hypothetical protein
MGVSCSLSGKPADWRCCRIRGRLTQGSKAARPNRLIVVVYNPRGGENGPVTVAAFKAADSALCGSNGGFDSHTPPPMVDGREAGLHDRYGSVEYVDSEGEEKAPPATAGKPSKKREGRILICLRPFRLGQPPTS